MKNNNLSEFGLNKNENKTYLTLLEIGPSSILEISRTSNINRSMLYSILEDLIIKGLVYKSIRRKKTRFVAQNPEVFRDILSEKLEKLEKILPDLKSLATKGDIKPSMTYYEGIPGIKQVYLGAIYSKEKKLFAFVGVESLLARSSILEKFWDEKFKIERRKRNVFGYLLVPDNLAGRKFQKKDNKNFRESRLVDSKRYNFPAEILMFDDNIAFISYTQYEEFAVTIQSPAIAETLKMVWGFMWDNSKK